MSRNDSEIVLKSSASPELERVFSITELTLRTGVGDVVPLRRQSAKVLEALIASEGKIVSKEELVAKVWGKTVVTDDSLTQCISDIRKALGECGRQIVSTHARKGYSLKSDFSSEEPKLPYQNSTLAALCVAAATAAAFLIYALLLQTSEPSGKPRLAVLAFEDFSPAPDQGYLSDAIAEGITAELARFTPFSTVARNSSFSLRGKELSIEEVGDLLIADYVLEGSQQKLDEKLVVTVQLIETESGEHIWAEIYDGSVSDLFDFQADIIRRVASTVGGQLAVFPGRIRLRETVTAMHLNAIGLRHQRKAGPENFEKARSYFEAAIEADPKSAIGYRGMGFYYRNTAWQAPTKSEQNELRAKARVFLETAIELDPENYLNHYLMGHLHSDSGDFDLARAQYDKTKKLNPSFSNAFVGGAASLIYHGELDAAIADIRYGMTIDPLHPEWFHRYLAWASWTAGDCTAAQAALDQMTRPSTVALKTEAVVQICLGASDAAKIAVQAALEREPKLSVSRERESFEGVWTNSSKLDGWLDALRQAGLPE